MRLILFILKIILILILPFILLIRGSVYFHDSYNLIPWVSILLGTGLTVVVIIIYFTVFYGKLTGRIGGFEALVRRMWLAMILVIFYVAHGIFYFSSANLKNKSLQEEIRQVHPILRLSVSTIIHLDKSLVITDANRVPEDYRKMGLRAKNHSLHYKQSDGYTHALDLRTNKRSMLRNFLLQNYFRLMGFNTLRHVGTDDHLHISIKSFDHPQSI